jgi:hypothetical protein
MTFVVMDLHSMDTMSNKKKAIWLNENWTTPEQLKCNAETAAWYMSLPRKNREGVVAVMKKKSDKVVPYWTLHSKLCGFRSGRYYSYEDVFGDEDDDSDIDSDSSEKEDNPVPSPIE